jgi:two-component system response regulator
MNGILFVEDDIDDVELARLGFSRAGLELGSVARDGQEALDALGAAYAEGKALPDLVLTDLKMPRVDGLELLRRLKQDHRLKDIPVAVLSSSGDAADRAEALRLGASLYLLKPPSLQGYATLADMLRALLQARRNQPKA